MVIIFFLVSTLLLKQNDEKHNPKHYFTINLTRSWLKPNWGRVYVYKYHPRFRTNRVKTKTPPRLQRMGKLLNPGPYFSVINLLLTQGRGSSRKHRNRNEFTPAVWGRLRTEESAGDWGGGGAARRTPCREEAASPPPGRALPTGRPRDRAAAAAPPAAGRPLTPPRGLPRPRARAEASRQRRFLPPRPFLFA